MEGDSLVLEKAMRRIRELEAELAEEKQLTEAAWRGHAILTVRAEKAEAFVNEWNEHPLRSRKDEEKYWYARFKEQQARVAELERRLRGHHPSDRAQENCLVCCGEEAREREVE